MCGIAGLIGPAPPDPGSVARLQQLMRSRGPDAAGLWQGRLGGHHLTLVHSRLAIVDLDPRANQPFAEAGCVLVYNGEIYNHRELRGELRAAGEVFRTESDTEVLVKAWRRWGDAALDRFEGMWAFALLDQAADRLVLSRDRFGEKPLYWAARPGQFAFGSEAKYLPLLLGQGLAPDRDQIRRYLVNGYRSLYRGGATFLEDVGELPAASLARLDGPAAPVPRRYWHWRHRPQPMSRGEALEGVRGRLRRALEWRLRADVKIAFCLSGGVDSTVLAGMAVKQLGQPVHAFSIVDADPRYDESDNLAPVVAALGCDHHVVRTAKAGFLDRLSEQVAYHDAPVATISYYVHDFLSQAIRAHGYKVAISGTGADELFTGYYDHYAFWLAARADRPDFAQLLADWRDGYGRVVRNPLLQDPLAFHRNPAERGHLTLDRDLFNGLMAEPLQEGLGETAYSGELLRNRMANELFHESVPVLLHEDDLDSMRHSVENRSPYLDRDLTEFLATVPSDHLIADGLPKWLLRQAGQGLVPDAVLFDRRKRGFNASIDSLLDRGDANVRERLLDPGAPIFDLVDRGRLAAFLDGDMTDNARSKFLFSFVSAKLFLETPLARGQLP